MYGEIEGRLGDMDLRGNGTRKLRTLSVREVSPFETPFRSPQLGQDGNALRLLPHHLHDRRSADKVGAYATNQATSLIASLYIYLIILPSPVLSRI